MKRDLYKKLLEWKTSERRKPLILKGARQVGKTYILKEFGQNEYEDVAYFNFEQDSRLDDFFNGRINPHAIIERLSIYLEKKITPGRTLVIFDEVQNSPEALNSLKYFQEEANEFHIASAGSLLGLKVGKSTPFPVGKVTFLELYPFSFGEFLEGIGRPGLRQVLNNKTTFELLETSFHEELLQILRLYYFIGGMPEAVAQYVKDKDLKKVRNIQNEILAAYLHDFAKHTTKTEAIRLSHVWDAIPGQLAKENKKFKYTEISKYARSRDYADSIQWLTDAGVIFKCFNIKTPKLPLSGYREDLIFKVYLLDVGLLGSRLGLSERTILEGNRLFAEYNGAFVENFVAQELVANGFKELYYWTSKSLAEVDFIIAYEELVFPLEVKAGTSKKKKSLIVYNEKYHPEILSRTTLMNFKHDGNIYNYPLYGVSCFPHLSLNKASTS